MIPSLSDFVETGYQLPPSDRDVGLLRTGTIVTLPCQSTVGQTAPAASGGRPSIRRCDAATPSRDDDSGGSRRTDRPAEATAADQAAPAAQPRLRLDR